MKVKVAKSCPTLCDPMDYTESFPCGSAGKESSCNVRDLGSIPGLGRSPGGEDIATHSSILAGESPWTEEPRGLVGHD